MKKRMLPLASYDALLALRGLTVKLDTSSVPRLLRANRITPERAALLLRQEPFDVADVTEALDAAESFGVVCRVYCDGMHGAEHVCNVTPSGDLIFCMRVHP